MPLESRTWPEPKLNEEKISSCDSFGRKEETSHRITPRYREGRRRLGDRQGDPKPKKITFINGTVSSFQYQYHHHHQQQQEPYSFQRQGDEGGGGWPDKKESHSTKERPCTTTTCCPLLFDCGTGVNDLFIVPLPFSGWGPRQGDHRTAAASGRSWSPRRPLLLVVVVVLFESHYHFSSR